MVKTICFALLCFVLSVSVRSVRVLLYFTRALVVCLRTVWTLNCFSLVLCCNTTGLIDLTQ